MKVSKLAVTALFLGLITLATPRFAVADALYTYTGNPFSGFAGESCPPVCGIEASFTVASPLANNSIGYFTSSTLESFSITDGNVTFDQTNSTITSWNIQTDASGNISDWNIWVQSGSMVLLTNPHYDGSIYNSGSTDVPQAGVSSNPARWAESDPTATPEPSSLLLLSSGLVGLGFMKRKMLAS